MDAGAEYLFDDYFENLNLNDELESFYKFINDEDLTDSFLEKTRLTDIRNKNYKRYSDINLIEIENLSDDFEDIVNEIKRVYNFILPEELLNDSIEEAEENKRIIDLIYNYLNQIEEIVKQELKRLEKENNDRQIKIKHIDYSKVDKKTLEEILNKYNDIVLSNFKEGKNLFDDYKKQLKIKNDLNRLYKLINLEINDFNDTSSKIDNLNEEINKEIKNINDLVLYLEDLMPEKSKYEKEFLVFKDYFNSLIAYDDNEYVDISRVYHSLCESNNIKTLLNYFEESFIKEREFMKKEENFVYEKYGIKNIKLTLDYISANYMDFINQDKKEIINSIYEEINNDNVDLIKIYKQLASIVSNIWKNSVTNIYSYKETDDFCLICTNNQFMDPKHESILITKKMLERVEDYSDYQIGFVCDFNDNILYITDNHDIMTVEYNDMSNLKTPKQIEQEFLNFKVCNRIALNGYITKVNAVYFINDGDTIKYKKAVELANQYNLPLIVLKKDKI